jgi:ribose transport system ATP-binding protein
MLASPILEMIVIDKAFAGVQALHGVNLTLHPGEILALLGENGAGKSTLMKVLSGAHTPDAGTIRIQGNEVRLPNPQAGIRAGIAVIYQEFSLVPALSARANIFLGQESTRAGFVRHDQERRQVADVFARLGVTIDPETPCGRLSIAEQQTVEIARALVRDARILVLDEPTAALSAHEVERLFAILRELKGRGIGIIYISHRLDETFLLADRIMVMRDGANVGDWAAGAVARAELIERMVGRPLQEEFPRRAVTVGEPRLVVERLSRGRRVRDVSLQIRRGEVLGLAGLVGAGRTETARAIFGADRKDTGTITLDGKVLDIRSPRDAIRAGIGMLPEDRKAQGLVLPHAARVNFSLPNLETLSRAGFVGRRAEREAFARYVDELQIRLADANQVVRNLSGGNQQKIVLAKWLARHCEVFLFDEPTRGIDAGAKHEIYSLINRLAEQGRAILMISSELPELLGMADRILVMHEGRIAGEIHDVANAQQETILEIAMGAKLPR